MTQRNLHLVPDAGSGPGGPGSSPPDTLEPSPLDTLVAARARGLGVLRAVHQQKLLLEDLLARDFTKSEARKILLATECFFGSTRHKKLRAQTLEVIETKNLSLPALIAVAEQFKLLQDGEGVNRAEVLLELIESVGGVAEEVRSRASTVVAKHNRRTKNAAQRKAQAEGRQLPRERGSAHFSDTTDAADQSTVVVRNPHEVTAKIRAELNQQARRLMRKDSSLSLPEALNEAFLQRMRSGGSGDADGDGAGDSAGNPAGTNPSVLTPLVVLPVEGYTDYYLDEAGDLVFGLDNNTSIDARELLKHQFGDQHYFLLTSPEREPLAVYTNIAPETEEDSVEDAESAVNVESDSDEDSSEKVTEDGEFVAERGEVESQGLNSPAGRRRPAKRRPPTDFRPAVGRLRAGRDARSANKVQRILARAMTLVCPWLYCSTPACECDVHHLVPWRAGGRTDVDNLACACKPHNGRNDDLLDTNINGRLVMKDWEIYYQPPGSDELVKKHHPLMEMTWPAWARRQKPIDLRAIVG